MSFLHSSTSIVSSAFAASLVVCALACGDTTTSGMDPISAPAQQTSSGGPGCTGSDAGPCEAGPPSPPASSAGTACGAQDAITHGGTLASCSLASPLKLDLQASALGYFDVTVTPITPSGRAVVSIEAVGPSVAPPPYGGSDLVHSTSERGGTAVHLWLASGAAQTYALHVSSQGNAAPNDAVSVTVKFEKVPDGYPVGQASTALPIAKNAAIQSYFFGGFVNGAFGDYDGVDHWFKVVLAAGPVTVHLNNVPGKETARLELWDGAGKTQLQLVNQPSGDKSFTLKDTVAAGTYLVRVGNAGLFKAEGSGRPVPDSYTTPYTLLVSQ